MKFSILFLAFSLSLSLSLSLRLSLYYDVHVLPDSLANISLVRPSQATKLVPKSLSRSRLHVYTHFVHWMSEYEEKSRKEIKCTVHPTLLSFSCQIKPSHPLGFETLLTANPTPLASLQGTTGRRWIKRKKFFSGHQSFAARSNRSSPNRTSSQI